MDILDTDAYDRRQRRNTSCALLVSLLPFFLSAAAYFYLWTADAAPGLTIAAAKMAPALLLGAVVLSWRGSLSVAGGLLLSAVGDCCLVWPEHFLPGMAAFAAAHLLYSLSFLSGRYAAPPSPSWIRVLYFLLFAFGGAFYVHLLYFLQRMPNPELLTPGVGVYIFLLIAMATLALRSRHVLTLLGSLFFLASDFSLSLSVFKVTAPIEHINTIIMVTYYLAQLLIAVGDVRVAENKDDFSKWKRS